MTIVNVSGSKFLFYENFYLFCSVLAQIRVKKILNYKLKIKRYG